MNGILDSLGHDFCGESSSHVDIHRNIANAGSIDGITVSHSCYRIDASGIGTAVIEAILFSSAFENAPLVITAPMVVLPVNWS